MGQRDYMFRPVEAIIRSLLFDVFKSTLYNYVVACVMWRSLHQGLFGGIIYIQGVPGGMCQTSGECSLD